MASSDNKLPRAPLAVETTAVVVLGREAGQEAQEGQTGHGETGGHVHDSAVAATGAWGALHD